MGVRDSEVMTEGGKRSGRSVFENKAVLLGVIVIAQALVAIGLTQFMILPRLGVHAAAAGAVDGAALPRTAPVQDPGTLVGLEEIIVTLAGDSRRPRYLRINVNLEVKDRATADAVGERLPQLRDVVIMALSDRTAEELSRPEGKQGLRAEIFRRISEKLPPGSLMNIYFSDLVVQ